MSRPRGGVGVAALAGRIYAVGGHDGRAYLDSVEAYDALTGVWQNVTNISTCRAGSGVSWCECTVDALMRQPSYNSNNAPANSGGGVAYCV
jgi:kelch-like protein 8